MAQVHNRDRPGDTAQLFNRPFFALLDQHFVEYADYLASFGIVERATAIAGIRGCVKLKNIIGRDQSSRFFILQVTRGELRGDDRCNSGYVSPYV